MNPPFPGPMRPWVVHGAVVGVGAPVLAYTCILLLMGEGGQAAAPIYPLLVVLAVFWGLALTPATVPLGIAAALLWRLAAVRLQKPGLLKNWALLAIYFAAISGVATRVATGLDGPTIVATGAAFLTSASWTAARRTRPNPPLATSLSTAATPATEETAGREGYTRRRAVVGWALRGLVVAAPLGVLAAAPDIGAAFLMGGPIVLLPMLMVSFMTWVPLAATLAVAGAIFGSLLSLDDRPLVGVPPISGFYFGVVSSVVTLIPGRPTPVGGGVTVALVSFTVGWLVALRYPTRADPGTTHPRQESET